MIEIIIDTAVDIDQGPTGPQQLMWRVGRGGGREISAERDECVWGGFPVWKCPRPRRYSKLYSRRWGDESQAEVSLTNRRQREREQPGQLQTGPHPPTTLETLGFHCLTPQGHTPGCAFSLFLSAPGSSLSWFYKSPASPDSLLTLASSFNNAFQFPSSSTLYSSCPGSHTPEASRTSA